MALLLAIIAPVSAPFLLLTDLNGIGVIPSYRGIVFPVPLLLLLLKILPFFICAGGLSGLSRFRAGWSVGRLCFLGPGLLGAGFLGGGSLGLHLRGGVVGRAVAPGTTGIRFPDHGAGP